MFCLRRKQKQLRFGSLKFFLFSKYLSAVNVAYRRPVSCSSALPSFGPERAVDDSYFTCFRSKKVRRWFSKLSTKKFSSWLKLLQCYSRLIPSWDKSISNDYAAVFHRWGGRSNSYSDLTSSLFVRVFCFATKTRTASWKLVCSIVVLFCCSSQANSWSIRFSFGFYDDVISDSRNQDLGWRWIWIRPPTCIKSLWDLPQAVARKRRGKSFSRSLKNVQVIRTAAIGRYPMVWTPYRRDCTVNHQYWPNMSGWACRKERPPSLFVT